MTIANWHDQYMLEQSLPTRNGWRPIASAPKDETLILAFGGHQITTVYWCAFSNAWLVNVGWDGESAMSFVPTHWQPLPAPPQ